MSEPSLAEAVKMLRHLAAVTCHPACTEPAHSPHELVALEAGADALEQLQAGHGCPVTVTGLDHGDGRCVLSRGHSGDHLTRQEIDHTRDRLALPKCPECNEPIEPNEATVVAFSTSYQVHAECGDDSDRAGINPLQAAQDRLAEYENASNWTSSCTGCAKMLDASIAEHERADAAEDYLDRASAKLTDYRSRIESLCDQLAGLKWVVEAARSVDADAPDPWRSKSDAANQLRRALAALDPESQRQPRP